MGLGEDCGVVIWITLDVFDDLFDAVADVFEFSVEGFVMTMADPAGT